MSKQKKILNGIVKRHPDGFGFLIPDDQTQPDVYIPKHSMIGIMTNDHVTVDVIKEHSGSDRFRGEIINIVSRGIKTIVGRLNEMNDKWMIVPDESKGWGADLRVNKSDILNAKPGDLVHINILQYPTQDQAFTGKVVEVIGKIEDPLTDVKRVLRGLSIPVEFSPSTLSEVSSLHEDPSEVDFKSRRDLRSLPLITIDGATAKDFDDAVYTEMTPTGFKLYVAIADVSHYVKPGTSLDKDAYERGTSVYFPNYVVPMLPEVLSNGLCSLKPNVPRLCVVAEMLFNFQGEMEDSEFYEAVMQSKARVTYGEAQELIDGAPVEKILHVKETILRCADLAKLLMARRYREGALDLNIHEVELEIDATGNPIDVQRSERLFSHKLIEELMLAANVAVAKFLDSKQIPAVYRVHDDPSGDAIGMLERYLHNLGSGYRLGGGADNLQKRLNRVLQDFAAEPEGHIINILTLRSLAQAKYSTQNVGHFGLGYDFYTHFTSPIRRYPDLIVHRLIKSQVVPQRGYRTFDEDELTTACNMLSACEQRAVKSERQFNSIKKARFMSKFVDQEFTGLVSSVARFGIFVLLREYEIDGLVKVENLGDDKWEFDEDNLRLVGQRSKKVFSIGHTVKIRVANADPVLGQVDFDLLPEDKAFGGKKRHAQGSVSYSGKSDRRVSDRRGSDRRESDQKNSGGRGGDRGRGKKFREKDESRKSDKDHGQPDNKKKSFKEKRTEAAAKHKERKSKKTQSAPVSTERNIRLRPDLKKSVSPTKAPSKPSTTYVFTPPKQGLGLDDRERARLAEEKLAKLKDLRGNTSENHPDRKNNRADSQKRGQAKNNRKRIR